MATNELAKLASADKRQAAADGVYDMAVPGLTLYCKRIAALISVGTGSR